MKYEKLTLEELKKELNDRDETIKAKDEEIKGHKKAVIEKDKELQGALKVNDNLTKKLEAKPAPVAVQKSVPKGHYKTLEFKNEGDTYGYKLPHVNHKGQKITATIVNADAKLQDELVKMQSGMVYKKK